MQQFYTGVQVWAGLQTEHKNKTYGAKFRFFEDIFPVSYTRGPGSRLRQELGHTYGWFLSVSSVFQADDCTYLTLGEGNFLVLCNSLFISDFTMWRYILWATYCVLK
jgi:hypothetical protein